MHRRWLSRVLRILACGVLCSIGITIGAAGAPEARQARVVTSLAPGSGVRAVEARVVVTTHGGEESAVAVQVPGEVTVQLADSGSKLQLKAPGFWSRNAVTGPGEVRLRLHPLTRIEGTLSVVGRGDPPERLRIFLEGPTLLASVTLLCPVDREGRYACEGPAGRFDLQLRADGFAPHFLWDVDLAPRRASRLAAITLQPGASITGFVLRPDGVAPGREATVRLFPQVVRDSGGQEQEAGKPLSILDRETRPGERGFFAFSDVTPGRYDVEAAEPGWTPARVEGIEVLEGSETHLVRPLEITEPVALQVQLSPAVAPSGKRWRLRIFGEKTRGSRKPILNTCDEQGYAEFAALPEDTYLLLAEDPGNGQPFGSRAVEVAAPLAFVDWELPLVAVEGRVRLGREPLAAEVTFGPTKAASRKLESDEDGLFTGVLPRAGEWDVLVESRKEDVSRWFQDVEVPEPSKPGEKARVALDLPATKIRGLIVDEEYRPVQGQVIAQPLGSRDRALATWAEPDGSFTLRGLSPGPVDLVATLGEERTSPVKTVLLPPNGEVGPIQLRVERNRTVQGTVSSPDGPVRGAQISVRGAGSALYLSTSATARSDARGTFSLEVPAALQDVQLQIRAPGRPFTVRRTRLGETLHLMLEPVWGTVELDWDQELNELLWMVKDGTSWRFSQFVSWAMAHPGEGEALPGHTRVPRLEPGVWHLCAPPPGTVEWLEMVAVGLPGRTCKRIEVTAWGTATAALKADGTLRKE